MGPVLRHRPRPVNAGTQPWTAPVPSSSEQPPGFAFSATSAPSPTPPQQGQGPPAAPSANNVTQAGKTSQPRTSSPAPTEDTDVSTASSSSWEHTTPPSSPATSVATHVADSPRASPSPLPLSAAVPTVPAISPADVTGPQTPAGTIIFRPVGRRSNFLAVSRDAIAGFLAGFPATRRVRVNFRRNLVAVDTHPSSDHSTLLQVAVICEVSVKSKLLGSDRCVGLVFGVDDRIDAEAISANISSPVPVAGCVRRGKCLTITFEGTTVPKEILLFKQRRPVRPRLPRPLQCTRCGRYGHATSTCSLAERCLRCGGTHAADPCSADRPHCVNCGGNHLATDPRCSSWQLQRKAAVILASSDGSVTRRQALERARNVVNNNRQSGASVAKGRSFRDALAGSNIANIPAPTPSPTSASDLPPKDAVLAVLAAAVRAVLHYIPDDSPARVLCAAALAAHDAIAAQD